MEAQLIVQCFLIFLICLIISAVCVTGKFAFAQLRKEYLEELIRDGDIFKAATLLYDKPIIFLATAQLGMACQASSPVPPGSVLYSLYGLSNPTSATSGILWLIDLVVAIILCFILWVFGELIPKIRRPSAAGTEPAHGPPPHPSLEPSAAALHRLGNGLGRLILADRGLDVTNEIDLAHSEDEIQMPSAGPQRSGHQVERSHWQRLRLCRPVS